jgi:hypothetical protein
LAAKLAASLGRPVAAEAVQAELARLNLVSVTPGKKSAEKT